MEKMIKQIKVMCMAGVLALSCMTMASAQEGETMYLVQQDDTLTAIAQMYQTDVDTLCELNEISRFDILAVDSELIVPDVAPEALDATPVALDAMPSMASAYDEAAPVVRSGSVMTASFKDANVKDVISVVALELNRSVIFKGDEEQTLTFKMTDATPTDIFETALALADLTYVQDGDVYIVGERDEITDSFLNNVSITRFSLRYVTADMVSSQLNLLGVDAELITSDENPKSLWVQGLPAELSKVSQVISAIDRNENLMAGSAELKNNFTTVITNYITASELSGVLSQCDLPAGIVVGSNPNNLYIYASEEDLAAVSTIKNIVDVPESSISDEVFTVYLSNVTAQEIEAKLAVLELSDVRIYTSALPQFAKSIIVSCAGDQVSNVRRAITSLDMSTASVTLPVDSAEGSSGSRVLTNRRALIAEMSDLSVSLFKISTNISKDIDNPRYVMYLTASPEDIQLVRDIVAEIDGI